MLDAVPPTELTEINGFLDHETTMALTKEKTISMTRVAAASGLHQPLFDEQQRRALQVAAQRLHELRGVLSIDHPVIERRREIHQAS